MKIIQSARDYKIELKLKKNNDCPECGQSPMFTSRHTETKGFLDIKMRTVNTVRCSCGCLYEYYSEWK